MSKMKSELDKKGYYDGLYEGMRQGIRLYAWWKDGIQYVGATGTTLLKAIDEIDKLEFSVNHSGYEPSEIR